MSSSKAQPSLKSLDYINPKLGSLYYRSKHGEGLCYATPEAFLVWKSLPSTEAGDENRPYFIFLHDYGSSSRIYNPIVSKVKNYCLAIDFRGWGRSNETKDETDRAYSVTQMKNQIPPLVALLQGKKFLIIGHGMGAKVAMLYASQQPPKGLVGLVLLSPVPLSAYRPSKVIMEKYRAAYKPGGNLERFIRKTPIDCPIDMTDLCNLVEDGQKDTPLAKEAWLTYGMDEDHSHGLSRIHVPVVVRVGLEDQIIAASHVEREISDKLTLVMHFYAQDCGHLVPLEDDELPRTLEKFSQDAEDLKMGRRVDPDRVYRSFCFGALGRYDCHSRARFLTSMPFILSSASAAEAVVTAPSNEKPQSTLLVTRSCRMIRLAPQGTANNC